MAKGKTACYNLSPSLAQATSKTLAQQEERLKKMETIGALQETNRMLKMDRDKLEQELQQAQARVRLSAHHGLPRVSLSLLAVGFTMFGAAVRQSVHAV